MMMNLKKAEAFITRYTCFLILPHVKADGDALGSSLALKLALNRLGKRAVIWHEDPLLHSLVPFFQGSYCSSRPMDSFDALISVDTADLMRLGKRYCGYESLPLLNIDHHATNEGYGEVNVVQGDISSTGELLYSLLEVMNIEITPEIANALYIAVVTDTNRFFYSNTSPKTLRVAANLLEAGADFGKIHRHLFGEKPLSLLRLLGFATEKTEFLTPNIVFCRLTKRDMDEAGFFETDDVINMLRDIEGVDVAALVYDQDQEQKLSLRSKGQQNVDALARHFKGGGHLKAAGATVFEEDIPLIKAMLKELADAGKDLSI